MANTKISQLSIATPVGSDIGYFVDDPAGSPASRAMYLSALSGLARVTELGAGTLAGATSIAVRGKPAGIGDKLVWAIIDPYTTECEIRKVSGISGLALTVAALTYAHAAGDPVIYTTRPLCDVLLFGALVDGSTDDTTAYNRAITQASAFGGTVLLAVGTSIATAIKYKSNIQILGQGWGSIIKLANAGNDNVFRPDDVANGHSNVQFKDFKIDGNRSQQTEDVGTPRHGIALYKGTNIEIDGMWITNTEKDAIYLGVEAAYGINSGPCGRVRIRGNQLTNTRRHGIGITSGRDIIVSGNNFDSIGDWGIDLEPNSPSVDYVERVIIGENTFVDCGTEPYSGAGAGGGIQFAASGNKFRAIQVVNNIFWSDTYTYRPIMATSSTLNFLSGSGNISGGLASAAVVATDTDYVSLFGNIFTTEKSYTDYLTGIGFISGSSNDTAFANIIKGFYYALKATAGAGVTVENINLVGNLLANGFLVANGGGATYKNVQALANLKAGLTATVFESPGDDGSNYAIMPWHFFRKSYAAGGNTDHETIIAVTNTDAPRTITIDSDEVGAGRILIVKDESGGAAANNITIATEAGEKIDGQDTKVISANYGSVSLYSNGTDWFSF